MTEYVYGFRWVLDGAMVGDEQRVRTSISSRHLAEAELRHRMRAPRLWPEAVPKILWRESRK